MYHDGINTVCVSALAPLKMALGDGWNIHAMKATPAGESLVGKGLAKIERGGSG